MSPDESKPNYIKIVRTHYPIPTYEGVSEEDALIARKTIIRKFRKIGIYYNPEKMSRLKL